MATHIVRARHQQKIDTTANWHALEAMILREGEIGIERKDMGDHTAYLMKVGDGASRYAELPYLQAVAADVYAWAKNINLIEGVLATYSLDESKTGRIGANDSLKDALNKIENAIASAMTGDGEINQNAFSAVQVGQDTLQAANPTDTMELVAGENITLEADTETKSIVISSDHPPVDVSEAEQGTLQPGFGDSLSVVEGIVRDEMGHVTAITHKQVTLPELPEIRDTITRVGITADAEAVDVDSAPASGDVTLGDAAARTVSDVIPREPTAAQHSQLPTLEAVKAYTDGLLAANDAMVFKGTIGEDGAAEALPAKHDVGWTYRVITDGEYAGHACEVGDLIICITKGSSTNDAHWTVAQTNVDGAVTADDALPGNALLVGAGGKRVAAITLGTSGQVLKAGEHGPVWSDDLDTRVADVANDTGKVFTGLNSNTTVERTDVAGLKLTGYLASETAEGSLMPTDTLGDAFNKLGEAIARKTETDGTVREVSVEAGGGITVTGDRVTETGSFTVAIDNAVPAQLMGLHAVAHNGQGLITASQAVTSISTDMLADGEDTLIFYAGTSIDVV